MVSEKKCAICDCEITKENDSIEHVIPNSIGGRKKVRGFTCNACNNSAGQSWDAVLASQLNWFSAAIGIARARGSSPGEVVKTVDGKEFFVRPNGTLTLKDPFFKVVESNGKANVRMFARSQGEARQMLHGIKKKYPAFDLEAALKETDVEAFRVDSQLKHRLELGGPETGRSLVKTAIAQCFKLGICPNRCEIGLLTLRTPNDNSAFAPAYGLEVLTERPHEKLFHLVAVYGDPVARKLSAYVEYFGVLKTFINLSDMYEGEKISFAYSIDPQSGSELKLPVRWALYPRQYELAFDGAGFSDVQFNIEVSLSVAVASRTRVRRERKFLDQELLAEVSLELGVGPEATPDESYREKFNNLMEEKRGSLSAYLQGIQKLPDL